MQHIYNKHRSQLGLQWKYFSSFLKLIIHVMCASLNKQLISCENCFGTLSGLSQERGLREISSGPPSWRATGWAGLSGSMHIVGHPTAVAIISTRWGHSYANFCLNEVWRIHSRSALIVRCVKQTWLLVIQKKMCNSKSKTASGLSVTSAARLSACERERCQCTCVNTVHSV
jgi:hypothetical protein